MTDTTEEHSGAPPARRDRGRTVHGEAANAGHRVLAPDDAEVEAYLEQALHAPPPDRAEDSRPSPTPSSSWTSAASSPSSSPAASASSTSTRELLPHDTPWAEIERRQPKAIILSGGPSSVYDDGCAAPRSGDLVRPDPGAGHLLRPAADGPSSWVARWSPAPSASTGRHRSRSPTEDGLFRGIDREQPVWMSHGDSILRPPDGFVPTAQSDSLAVRRTGRCRARPVRHPVPPRSRPHAARQGAAAQLRRRASRALAPTGRRRPSSRRPSPSIRAARRRPGTVHLRALRRRGLGGCGRARAPGDRRPADLHLRRPRPDAQARVRAAARHLRRAPGHAAGHRRRRATGSWRAWRA